MVVGITNEALAVLAAVMVTAGVPESRVHATDVMALPLEPGVAMPARLTVAPRETGLAGLADAVVVGRLSANVSITAASASSKPAPHAWLPKQKVPAGWGRAELTRRENTSSGVIPGLIWYSNAATPDT